MQDNDLGFNKDFLINIMNSSPNGVVVINKDGEIKFLNETLLKTFLYSREEVLNQKIEILIPSRFRPNHPNLRSTFFENPTTRKMGGLSKNLLFGLKKDGTEFPLEIGLNPVTLDNELYVIGSIIDITERRKIEKINENIVHNSSDAIITKSLDGVVTSWNPGAENIFEFTEEEAVGKNITDLIYPKSKLFEEKEFVEKIKSDKNIEHYETTRVTKSNNLIQVSIALTPLRDSDGIIVGLLTVVRNITAQKHELLLKEVHHRIKNNLAIITSLIQMEARRLNSPSSEILDVLQSTRNRIQSISRIHEKLYASKTFNNIEISDYFKGLVQDLQNNLSEEIDSEVRINIFDNNHNETYLQLEKAIPCGLICVEFITNSFKHAFSKEQSEKKIDITISITDDNKVKIVFHDNGEGSKLVNPNEIRSSKTLGLNIIDLLSTQLEADKKFDFDKGAFLEIIFKNDGGQSEKDLDR